MTVIMVGRFREDRNATSVAYKKYSETWDDQYPTFSICFRGQGLYRYNESAIFKALRITPMNYKMMLEGRPAFRYDYIPSSKLYAEAPVPLRTKTGVEIEEMLLVAKLLQYFLD